MHPSQEQQPIPVEGRPISPPVFERRGRALSLPSSCHGNKSGSTRKSTRQESQSDGLKPPLTLEMLRQFDETSLEMNLQIRHDLTLSPDLKLRALRHASDSADPYWRFFERDMVCITNQLTALQSAFFEEVRQILRHLYPRSYAVSTQIWDFSDPSLINQMVERGVFDPIGWIRGLAGAILQNCAPKRDKQVEEMVALAEQGFFATSARLLINLLEDMKIDLANYTLSRIKTRPLHELIARERALIKAGPLTHAWIKSWQGKSFIESFIDLIMHYDDSSLPETLILDRERIKEMHKRIHDVIYERSIKSINQCTKCPTQVERALRPESKLSILLRKRVKDQIMQFYNKKCTIPDLQDISRMFTRMIVFHWSVHAITYRTLLLSQN